MNRQIENCQLSLSDERFREPWRNWRSVQKDWVLNCTIHRFGCLKKPNESFWQELWVQNQKLTAQSWRHYFEIREVVEWETLRNLLWWSDKAPVAKQMPDRLGQFGTFTAVNTNQTRICKTRKLISESKQEVHLASDLTATRFRYRLTGARAQLIAN